ncbi:MAG: CvpA family protein [Saprospiraceae bacterium]|nr:CvpA family protein [Saprospiraceae bacterium]MBK9727491.1 CvpA family protein [Saprospiraceae bacterium]
MFIDILCAIILGGSFYLGYTKGIIKSVFGIVSILLAILVTLKFSFLMINLVEKILVVDPRLTIMIGFVLTFLLIMIGIRLIGRGFEKILETAHINFINQLAGGITSAIIALVIYSSVIWFFNQLNLIGRETKEKSVSYYYLEAVPAKSKWAIDKCKPIFFEFWQKTQEALNKVESEIPKK